MGKEKRSNLWFFSSFFIFFLLKGEVKFVQCQNGVDPGQLQNPAVLQLVTQLVYAQLSNMTSIISSEIGNRSTFCIKDPNDDWNRAFNFSSNLDFLGSCILKTGGDISKRLCTTAEVKFYFSTFFESGNNNYLKPNKNCNLTSWVSGCEPGWACSVGQDQTVDITSNIMPSRTLDCDTCCDGFFCPHGLTCMIPCPLGAYCPQATLNKSSGVCQPYTYQLPPALPNHTCGGANIWADVGRSSEVFCSAGSYCPTTVNKHQCGSGHYCRTGSTSEKRCFKLTSCDPNTANQNMQAYGIMLIAALSTLLLILYNCSDQVLTTRERRLAKSREIAARSARETSRARERWKNAKDAAKKRAAGLKAQLSRTFSREKSGKLSQPLEYIDQTPRHDQDHDDHDDDDFYQHSNASTSRTPGQSSRPNNNNLSEIMHAIDVDPESIDGFNIEPSHESVKNKHLKPKHMHTRTQIFKYAYAQLEKEKAFQEENKNLTFSGVISMATHAKIKTRPLIEINFINLTITLKGKNKNLLRCVTGKIKPGRITAVMGPSGAGKTTFLSALAGKIMGCNMTGLILINGASESIHSYKRIMGFVPQDDIVHGNLTVEENLWFSANCRLPANMPKADKVLIVERVIESLGLQGVRDSLVGTVEKRGISGGQRKRVNVGLEMVMEPSLLILDEPTSGLDSSSSLLLLRALRREALEGVNICMVVHQPSYTLYRMFDDLILLAKGGLTAYHGPMRKAEEYFADIGITIPDRINPPDHFIDVLEGIVKPTAGSGWSHEDLPVRWMLHNNYQIPPDMKRIAESIANSSSNAHSTNNPSNLGRDETGESSFAGELWQDVRANVVVQQDKIRYNFLKMRDLSKRSTPGLLRQYKYFLGRVGKQRLRESRLQAIDYLILLLAGACLGSITKASDATFGAAGYTYTIIAISLLCKIAALRSFCLDKLEYWRESASGMSSLAYFLAKDTVDHLNTLIKPVVYLSMYYFFNNPRSTFLDNYIVLVCLVYCVTGIAYALAIFFETGPAQLWSVLLPVILTLVATQPRDNGILNFISKLCYPRWALEAFIIANAERYYGVWLITRCGSLLKTGYDLHNWGRCIEVLLLIGLSGRVLAFIGMVTFQRK